MGVIRDLLPRPHAPGTPQSLLFTGTLDSRVRTHSQSVTHSLSEAPTHTLFRILASLFPSTECLWFDGGSATPCPRARETGGNGGLSIPDRQGQLVSGEEGSCAPGPSLSPPVFPLLSVGPPAQARLSPPSAVEFPQRSPPCPQPGGGGGGEQAQAGVGGNSPPPPRGPTPPNPLISQRRPPAAPRAWGEASAGAWEGGGGRQGGDGW